MRLKRPVSHLQLFRVLLGIRWVVLALVPVQEGLNRGGPDKTGIWVGIAVAAAYTLALTAYSRRALAFHQRSLALEAFDMAVMFGLYLTGSGTTWSFFVFSTTTLLLAGLRGSVAQGLVAALAWNALTMTGQWIRGVRLAQVFGIVALEDIFNLCMITAAWAFSVGLIVRLNRALDELSESRDALSATNAVLDEREKEVLGLLDVGEAILAEHNEDEILRIVFDALKGMGFGRSRVWLLEESVFRAEYPRGEMLAAVPATSEEPLSRAVSGREPVTVELGATERIPGVAPRTLAIVLPILAENEALGALVVESLSREPYDDNEIEMLELFADQIALALQHVRFYQQARDYAVTEERIRMAAEMRDTVVQKIYGANLLADSLRHAQVPKRVADGLWALQEAILDVLKDVRFAVLNWDSLGWDDTLWGLAERYTSEFTMVTGIPVSFVASIEERAVAPGKVRDVLAALQEALANVWRHAHARSAQVDLALSGDTLSLSVRDDGRGFEVAGPSSAGIGLRDIRERALRHQGTVEVESAPGDGTQVRIRIPC
jgi:signal transduction histidine kinase